MLIRQNKKITPKRNVNKYRQTAGRIQIEGIRTVGKNTDISQFENGKTVFVKSCNCY